MGYRTPLHSTPHQLHSTPTRCRDVVCGVTNYEIHPSNGDLGAPSWMENQPLACPHCGHPDDDHESLFLGGKCFYCDDCEGWA